MTKKQIFYLGLFASITILSSGFRPFQPELFPWFHVFEKEEMVYTVPTEVELNQTFSISLLLEKPLWVSNKVWLLVSHNVDTTK